MAAMVAVVVDHWDWIKCFGFMEWIPEWTCLRCNASVTLQHNLLAQVPAQPTCPEQGPRTLVLDIQRGERGWVCASGTNIHHCQPTGIPATTASTAPQQNCTNSPNGQWLNQGPPHHQPGPTNSWLYVPLLHAGAGRLTQAAEQAWNQAAHSPNDWQTLVQHLRRAQPVPWQQLYNCLVVLQDIAAQSRGPAHTRRNPSSSRTGPGRSAVATSHPNSFTMGHRPTD